MMMHPHLPGWADSQGRTYNRIDPLRLMDDLECSKRFSQDRQSVRKPYVSSSMLVSTSKVEAGKTAKCVGDYRAFLFGKKESEPSQFNHSHKLTSRPPIQSQANKECKTVTKIADYRKKLFGSNENDLNSSTGPSSKLTTNEIKKKNTSSTCTQLTFENLTDYLNSLNAKTSTNPRKRQHSNDGMEDKEGYSSTDIKKRRFNH